MVNIADFSKKFLKGYTGNSPWPVRVFLCLAVFISYANVWPNEFLFNDGILITRDQFLKHWSSLPRLLTSLSNAGYGRADGFYRPLEMLIYFFVYQLFGASTIAFHALNIALQALNACLLHHFGLRTGFKKGAVFAAALLWAVHPLHASNVAYMSSTAELLWGCFCLLGLIALLPDFAQRKVWRAMIFFVLALGCKESAVVFPALAAATFFFVSKNRAQISAYFVTWPLWLLSVCYIAVWSGFMHISGYALDKSPETASILSRLLTSLATLPVYARLIVWPAGPNIERDSAAFSTLLAWQPITGMLMAGLGLLQILQLYRHKYAGEAGGRKRALCFGLIWCAIALSPYTGIIVPVDARMSEGWMYVPAMGLFLGAAQAAAGFFKTRQQAARLLVLVMTLSLGMVTFFQSEIWRTPETLYQNIIRDLPDNDRFYDMGLFCLNEGNFDKAIEQFQQEVNHSGEHAKPSSGATHSPATTHMWLAMAWLQVSINNNEITPDALNQALPLSRHIPEALRELGKALQENPDFYEVHKILAVIYRYQGDSGMADFHLKQADAILKKQEGH